MRGRAVHQEGAFGEIGETPHPTCFAGHLLPQGEKGRAVPKDTHAAPLVVRPAARSLTADRKASPRCSKSANWSKEAQAGDRRTMASLPLARASAKAAAVAAAMVPDCTASALPFRVSAKA